MSGVSVDESAHQYRSSSFGNRNGVQMKISPLKRGKVGSACIWLEGDVSIKKEIISVMSRGNGGVNSWLFHRIFKIQACHRMNDSFCTNTSILVRGVGGSNKEKGSTAPPTPLCHPISFKPPTAEVGGGFFKQNMTGTVILKGAKPHIPSLTES